jgi:hypothetical protein
MTVSTPGVTEKRYAPATDGLSSSACTTIAAALADGRSIQK